MHITDIILLPIIMGVILIMGAIITHLITTEGTIMHMDIMDITTPTHPTILMGGIPTDTVEVRPNYFKLFILIKSENKTDFHCFAGYYGGLGYYG